MIGPFRRKPKSAPVVRTAVMPAPVDPALEVARQRISEICQQADERLDRILQRLRAQVPQEQEKPCPPTS